MKVIFLDFDGVLNSQSFLAATPGGLDRLDPQAIARLERIVARSGAKVVISSTWRVKRSLDELRALLAGLGFSGEVIDRTPELKNGPGYSHPFIARGAEIQAWIDAQRAPLESFVVLDDAILDGMEQNHIQTDFFEGLSDEHVEEAVAILGEIAPVEGGSDGGQI